MAEFLPIAVEQELALDPHYGLAGSCIANRESVQQFFLEILANDLRAVNGLRERLETASKGVVSQVLRSPVFQASLNQLARDFFEHQPPCENALCIIDSIVSALDSFPSDEPLESQDAEVLPGFEGDLQVYIWKDDRSIFASELRRLFQEQVIKEGGTPTIDLRTPDSRMLENLRSGSRLLRRVLPSLSRAMLAHTNLIGIVDDVDPEFWKSVERPHLFESGSSDGLPGVLFLTPNAVTGDWVASEALFHEACHQKLFDLVKTQSIYRDHYSGFAAQQIPCPWRSKEGKPDMWITDRALLAFHVYVYLALYYAVISSSTNSLLSDWPHAFDRGSEEAFRESADRAHYLGYQVLDACGPDLGSDGRKLAQWLMHQLQVKIDRYVSREEATERATLQATAATGAT